MAGGLSEWCADVFERDGPDAHSARGAGPPLDTTDASVLRVVRGGSWGNSALRARASYRSRFSPSSHYGNLGFRLSRDYP